MKRSYATYSTLAVALALALGGCSTWQHTSRTEKGTAVGATGGALVGAAVGGPVGAVVGAGVGGYAGHYETQPGGLASANGPLTRSSERGGNGMRYSANSDEIRSVQQALNDQGYNPGPVDGQLGPSTEDALRQFQQAQNLPQTGQPDARTLAALGVSNQASYRASNSSSRSNQPYAASNQPGQYQSSDRASSQSNQNQYQGSNEDETQAQGMASSSGGASGSNGRSDEIRAVQQALNDKGYHAGAVDGIMGPHTGTALRQFQQAQNLRQTGRPDAQTLAALGVSNQASNQASNESKQSNQASSESNQPSNQASNESNQSSNQASNLPGQPTNHASAGSTQSNESSPTPPSSNQASNQQQ